MAHVSEEEFVGFASEALDSLPADLAGALSNVEIVVEDEPPRDQPLLGLYPGVPPTRRRPSRTTATPGRLRIATTRAPATRPARGYGPPTSARCARPGATRSTAPASSASSPRARS